jgi:AraC-like DNA-binding protein
MSGPALLLGQAIGAYQARKPDPALCAHFACVWFHSVASDARGWSAIVPDGCADLIWFDGTLWIAGPDRQAKIECVVPGATVLGLRFQPGAASAWLRTPICDIGDARIPLEAFWGAAALRLAAWIGEALCPADAARRLEIALEHRLSQVGAPDNLAAAIFHLIHARSDYSVPVHDELSDAFGLSERTLRRRCLEGFGYGPKRLDRILRFQQFLRLARSSSSTGAADLAAGAGYADQPHLIREARHLADLTPNAIRQQLAL